VCNQYSYSKGDYYYLCDNNIGETYTEWQPVGSPTFSPQPEVHSVPEPSTAVLLLSVAVVYFLIRRKSDGI
jgi:hypothetical protein